MEGVQLKTTLKTSTKKCFVLLTRLDEKLLNKYIRRDTKTDGSCQSATERTINRDFKEIGNRDKSNCSSVRSVKKRKKRLKPLCYTDDEDDSAESKLLKSARNDRVGVREGFGLDSKETATEGEKQVERTAANSCEGSQQDNSTNIVEGFQGNVNCDEMKAVCDDTFIAESDFVEREESEDESRDDEEDDRSTVIFDKDANLEVWEGKDSSKKLKKKQITNRKKQRLIKFKRKSMSGRNVDKIRKSKSKLVEIATGQDTMEKNLNERDAEECLKKVCGSVRRLHDMYTIILQLQREMPKDTDLTIHFKRVINAQQENFHGEIRKTRKMIIKCFEKLMKPYKQLNRVASEVGKQISLSVDEVIYVVSLCMLSDGSCDGDKTEQLRSSSNNPCKVGVTRKEPKTSKTKPALQDVVIAEVPNSVPPPGSSLSPPAVIRSELNQRPAPAVTDASRAWLPPYNSHLQPLGNTQISGSRRSHPEEENSFRPLNFPRPVARRPMPMTHAPNTRSQYCNIPYSNPSLYYSPRPRPPSGYTSYPMVGHYQQVRNVPLRPDGVPTLGVQRPFGCALDKPAPYPMGISNSVNYPVLNTPRYSEISNVVLETNENSQVLNRPPAFSHRAGALHYGVVNGHVIPTSRSEPQARMRFSGPAGYPHPTEERSVRQSLQVPEEARDRGVETNPEPENTQIQASEVLDPTIPQKLTMKDCRLQAGPVLGSDVKKSEERTVTRSENVDQEISKTRVYICAQSNCKKPGIRICQFCQSVIYCSETCQLKHWETKHKVECCQLKELRG